MRGRERYGISCEVPSTSVFYLEVDGTVVKSRGQPRFLFDKLRLMRVGASEIPIIVERAPEWFQLKVWSGTLLGR